MENEVNKGTKTKTKKPIVQWILTVYFGVSLFVFFPSFASILYALVAFALCPTKNVRAIWDKIMPKSKLRTILVTAVAFIALALSPSDEMVTEPVESSSTIESSVEQEVESISKEVAESITENTEQDSIDDTAEIVTSEIIESVENTEDVYTGDSYFEVHYIDVGQGDSALVLCDGDTMLIDGGTSGNSSLIYSYLKKMDVHKLDYMVASHPHDDHVGGLAGALNFASVEKVLCSTNAYESEPFENFTEYVEKQGVSIEIPGVGDSFNVGSSIVEILGVNDSNDENNSSVVLKVTYGDTSFLFTGDAAGEAEQVLLDSGYDLNSTVLKVGHHGSSVGTTDSFLRAVAPEYAIISAGVDNVYEHPSKEVLNKLKDAEIVTYRTDLQGDIVCKSDGSSVTVTVEKNADADTLEISVVATPTPESIPAPTPESTAMPEPIPTLTVESTASPEATPENSGDGNDGNVGNGGGTGNPNIGQLEENEMDAPVGTTYVLNTNTKKFHYESCKSAKKIKDKNRAYHTGTREECINMGYDPCGNCQP